MKILLVSFLSLFLFTSAYSQDITYILVRHGEKDSNRFDPALSAEGQARANRFFEVIKKYNPDQIFSTPYKRTRLTVDPLATNLNGKYRIFVQSYDGSELEKFAQQLLQLKAKCVVIAGHSNTTPILANLLIKEEKYPDLGESVYNKIYIIKIKGTKITHEVIDY